MKVCRILLGLTVLFYPIYFSWRQHLDQDAVFQLAVATPPPEPDVLTQCYGAAAEDLQVLDPVAE